MYSNKYKRSDSMTEEMQLALLRAYLTPDDEETEDEEVENGISVEQGG